MAAHQQPEPDTETVEERIERLEQWAEETFDRLDKCDPERTQRVSRS